MTRARFGNSGLLPKVETLFIYARGLTALGIVLWLFFSPLEDPARFPVQMLLVLFAAHLGFLFVAVSRRWTSRKNIYWITLLFDVFLVTVLVRYTGGIESEFFMLYFLSVGFGSYYLGMNSGLLLSFIITLNYLLTNSQAIPSAYFGDLLMRLSMLWFFASGTGYISDLFRQAEERLLRTLNTLNERTSQLEKAQAELETVYDLAHTLGEHNETERIYKELLNISQKTLEYQHLDVLMLNQQRTGLHLVAHLDRGQTELLKPPLLLDLQGIAGYAARTGRPQRLYDIATDERYRPGLEGARSELAVPMTSHGRTIGVLNSEATELGAFTEHDEKLLSILAGSAALALENARLHKQLADESTTDELTGVHNYRYFISRLEEEQRRARRYDQPLSLIMVDVDWFKDCNDKFGHQAGNLVLKGIARVMRGIVRDTDVICRFGGDEFMVILPQTTAIDAQEIGQRIRQEVERTSYSEEGLMPSLSVKVSVGVTTYPDNGGTAENLVDMVDKALYRAKSSGKNVLSVA